MALSTTVTMHTPNNLSTLLSFLFFFFLVIPLCLGGDRITADQPLFWNQTIVSATGIFELGFFQPRNSSNYYIGMWHKQVPITERVIVWVANRDRPISDKYLTHLKISRGNLVLNTTESKTPIWSTNLTSTSALESLEAVLLDSGNLVLRRGPNPHHSLWQSSENPGNVWLPGYKIGYFKGNYKALTSWKNSEDPASGLYSAVSSGYTIKLTAQDDMEYWYSEEYNQDDMEYWFGEEWNKNQSFAHLPEFRNKSKIFYDFNLIEIDTEQESYLTYYVHNHEIPSMLVMDVSGQLKSFMWSSSSQKWNLLLSLPEQCNVYHYCGPFASCNQQSLRHCNCLHGFKPNKVGCSRQMQLQCMNSTSSNKRDWFWASSNMALPENPQFVEIPSGEDCELVCLNNCSCSAYASHSYGCFVWIGDLFNIKQLSDGDPNGETLYIRLNGSELHTSSDKKRLIGIIVGLVVGLSALWGLVRIVVWVRKRLVFGVMIMDGSLVRFRYNNLQSVTRNFSEKLGGGGFGSVFKGKLPNLYVAVKMLEGARQGEKQFRAEVSTIGHVQHVNLIRLFWFCSEGSKRLLIYEYMPNGSLNTHLFKGKDPSKFLSWKARFQIVVGIAKGLAYLHEKCRDCIIHCDIKPENILLDADFCPKIADFGLAKLFGREFSRVITTMRGTRGYLAPEWISGATITTKADVYSYGMMLFEFISGRRNTQQVADEEFDFFPTKAVNKISEGEDILSIVDQRLEGNVNREEVMRLCKLACWCIQDDESQRPTMGQVIQFLEGLLDMSMPPMPQSLQIYVEHLNQVLCFTEGSISQASTYASATSSLTHSASSYVTAKESVRG